MNFVKVYKNTDKCCQECNDCQTNECLIGFCKQLISEAMEKDEFYVNNGVDCIPTHDLKAYDKQDILEAVGEILKQCKNCKLYHDEDCLINVSRSALEYILTGQTFEYEGSAFVYLNDIRQSDQELGESLAQIYMKDS